MNILHIVWGFTPWREGGLIEYADDIMSAQVASGQRVATFFAGRRDLFGRPRLETWHRNSIIHYEVYNSVLTHRGLHGTFPAAGELSEPYSEKFFLEVLQAFRPHIIHVHELAGLPFSLLDICRSRGIPLVLTLHDYHFLCPALILYNQRNALCDDRTGLGCVECCRNGYDGGLHDRIRTIRANGWPRVLYAVPLLQFILWRLMHRKDSDADEPEVYRQRHDMNRQRFTYFDKVIAQSHRVREIFSLYTGRKDIVVAHSSLHHIDNLHPRTMSPVKRPVRFATLNGAMAPYKGSELLAETVLLLKQRGCEGLYQLDIYGALDRKIRRKLLASDAVRWHGRYDRAKLPEILARVDVGIVPSMCEEVYGYVGIEFLACGIPVIGNAKGGIVDYTRDGCSGWVNRSSTSHELASIMEQIIREPFRIPPLNDWIRKNRREIIADRASHLRFLTTTYEAIIRERNGAVSYAS